MCEQRLILNRACRLSLIPDSSPGTATTYTSRGRVQRTWKQRVSPFSLPIKLSIPGCALTNWQFLVCHQAIKGYGGNHIIALGMHWELHGCRQKERWSPLACISFVSDSLGRLRRFSASPRSPLDGDGDIPSSEIILVNLLFSFG